MPKLRLIISGGGTGGHIFPAIAIAKAVKKLHSDTEVLFVGALGRMEMEKVPQAGFNIVGLPIMGLQRSFSWKNLKFPFMLLKSLFMAKKIIKNFNPHVAVGVGGYASGPLLYSASKRQIPCLIQEQNSYAGITNRLLGKKVDKICVAFEGMDKFFPKEKILLTGNPVRPEVVDLKGKRVEAMEFFKLDENKKTLLVVGGSLGSWSINEAIEKHLPTWEKDGFQIIWQTGKLFYKRAQESNSKYGKWLKLHEFIHRMDLAYAVADLVVSRAGAIAVSELSLVKLPSILVPLPSAAEDHQSKNAMALVGKNAAVLIKDNELKQKLGREVSNLLKNNQRLQSLKENMKPLGHRDAAKEIAREILKLANLL